MSHPCIYCNKSYNIKYYFERHTLLCEFLHKSKSEKQMEIEPASPSLTDTQSNKLIIQMMYEFEKMKTKMKKMEDKIRLLERKQKIHLEQWLNSPSGPVPIQTLRELFQTIPITIEHLETIFKSDLLSAMLLCLKEALESMDIDGIPCCAFIQKPNILYFYDIREKSINTPSNPKWSILSKDDIISVLSILSYRFLQLFLRYSNEPRPTYSRTWSENEMIYSRKVMGKESCETTRVNCIKEYLYNTLKQNFVEIEII